MRKLNSTVERHVAGFVFAEQIGSESARRPAIHADVEQTLAYLHRNFSKPIRVEDLNARTKLSRRGFHKAFLMHTGMTPGVILRCVRIHRAKELLLNSNKPIAEIVPLVGYRSVNSFAVAFKATTGVSPGAFRARLRRVIFDFPSRPRNADVLDSQRMSKSLVRLNA